jgi:hypothetical protein
LSIADGVFPKERLHLKRITDLSDVEGRSSVKGRLLNAVYLVHSMSHRFTYAKW